VVVEHITEAARSKLALLVAPAAAEAHMTAAIQMAAARGLRGHHGKGITEVMERKGRQDQITMAAAAEVLLLLELTEAHLRRMV
jgi:hypothetical protein